MKHIRALWSVTAFRLSVIYTVLFGLFAIALTIFVAASTFDVVKRQLIASINDELAGLASTYEAEGLNATIRALEVRARAPGANLYVVADPAGRILAGNVLNLDAGVLDALGWTRDAFSYTRFSDDETHRAVARVFELPNGMRVLIGRDVGEPERFRGIIARALAASLGAMALLGIATWFLVGRRALKRIDKVSHATTRILAGDRDERLPVTGSGDEFDRLSRRLNEMLERIHLLDDGLKRVSDSIAHDLKTPITRIRNRVESALASSADEPDHRPVLESVIEEADRLIATFNALLMISRVEAGSSAAELTRIDLSEIVADVEELYQPVAEDAGFELVADIAQGVMVRGNRELLGQAISNLIDNAIKYAHGAGGAPAIALALSRDGDEIAIRVDDNGPGIANEDKATVVERFTRLEASRTLPGSGLGLSLVAAVAKLHDGRLELADANPGLSARLLLPAPAG